MTETNIVYFVNATLLDLARRADKARYSQKARVDGRANARATSAVDPKPDVTTG